MTRHRTTDGLRYDIDHGRGGDKTSFSDPAAAPLGTDDEAAGTPPTPEQLRLAHDAEIRHRPTDAPPPGAPHDIGSLQPHRGVNRWIVIAVAGLLAAIVLAVFI